MRGVAEPDYLPYLRHTERSRRGPRVRRVSSLGTPRRAAASACRRDRHQRGDAAFRPDARVSVDSPRRGGHARSERGRSEATEIGRRERLLAMLTLAVAVIGCDQHIGEPVKSGEERTAMAVNDDVEVRDCAAEKRLKAVAKVAGLAGIAGIAAERLTIGRPRRAVRAGSRRVRGRARARRGGVQAGASARPTSSPPTRCCAPGPRSS
jgi:hypothetical protein